VRARVAARQKAGRGCVMETAARGCKNKEGADLADLLIRTNPGDFFSFRAKENGPRRLILGPSPPFTRDNSDGFLKAEKFTIRADQSSLFIEGPISTIGAKADRKTRRD
jgi:hypothetical protein